MCKASFLASPWERSGGGEAVRGGHAKLRGGYPWGPGRSRELRMFTLILNKNDRAGIWACSLLGPEESLCTPITLAWSLRLLPPAHPWKQDRIKTACTHTVCVALGELFNLSEPKFLHW